MVFAPGAFVVFAGRRIGADHEEFLAGGEALVAGARWKDCDIARDQGEGATSRAAELHPSLAARDTKHLVNLGMIMDVIIDAVAPGIAPAVFLEQILIDRRGIEIAGQADGAPINDQRKIRMIGNEPVILEAE